MGVNVPGSLADAEKQALQALALDPAQGATYGALGIIYAAQGRWLEAQQKFDVALARDNGDPSLHQQYGLHLAGSVGHVRRFLDCSLQAQRLAPAWITALFTIGVAYTILGRTDEARRFMGLAVDLGLTRVAGPVPDVLSLFAMRTGRYDEALRIMLEALPPQLQAVDGEDTVKSVFAGMAEPVRRGRRTRTAEPDVYCSPHARHDGDHQKASGCLVYMPRRIDRGIRTREPVSGSLRAIGNSGRRVGVHMDA